jgi:hypothetical protein
MTRMQMIGIGVWIGCAVATTAAIGLGWATANDHLDKAIGVGATVAVALLAEALFWTGGALLGLSFFAKRGGWLKRLFRRTPAEGAQ